MPHSEFDGRDDYHEDDEFEHGENPEDDEPEDDEPEDDEPEDNELEDDELEDDEPGGGESSDEEENPGKGKTNTSDRRRFHIDEDSPPLSNLNDIYADLVSRGLELGLEEFLASLGNGTFVVATMCSGTESPILALQMIDDMLKKNHKKELRYHHAFSAEIVPSKQSYIELNFHPRILFRDIREMANAKSYGDEATTAFGSRAKVPRNVTILIAGSSCVDFSVLNTKRRGLADVGESGDTLRAILSYAKEYRPPLIILENIKNAPWEQIRAVFENDQKWLLARHMDVDFWQDEHPYMAHKVFVDTKQYYIPQTRNRGYMILVDLKRIRRMDKTKEQAREMTEAWAQKFRDLARPASASVEAFLLPADDPRLARGKDELSRASKRSRQEVDWTLCKGRHYSTRAQLGLGTRRPLTRWVNGGTATAPDYWWRKHIEVQVERIWDTIEMAYLRLVVRDNYDALWKFRVWDLSQSIDRYTDTTAFGVANCITPKGMPFVTYRGGPVIGLEQLALQGLPIDSLILTRHPHKEQQDMAGNAMTSTVVACAILSALIEFPAVILDSTKDNKMISPRKPKTGIGEFNLEHLQKQTNMELETAEHVHPKDVSQAAGLSVSLCSCEGPCNITKNPIYVCQKCGHLCCESCLGIPGHEYTFIDQNHLGRIEPWVFYEMIKKALPMRVTLSNLFYEDLEVMAKAAGPALDLKDWELYTMALKPALGEELYFQTVKRSHCWVVVYDGQKSRLELKLHRIRELFKRPVAQMRPTKGGVLRGQWKFCLPMTTKFTITIEGEGPLVDGWEKRLGIQREDLVTKKVWSSLRIKKTSIATVNLDRSLDGVYDLLPDCGTAFGSLHKQRSSVSTKMLETTLAFFELQTVDEPNYRDAAGRVARSLKSIIDEASALCDKLGKKRPLYLFLDPERIGKSQFDRFVFSTEKHRTVFEETRYTVARIDASWRPSERRKSSKICTTYGRWMGCEAFLSSVKGEPAESAVLENGPAISMYSDIEVVNIPELQLKQPSPTPESAEARFKRLFGPQEKTKPKLRITNDQTAPKTRNRYYVPFHGDDNTLATITYECKEATVAVLVCTVPNVVSNDLGMQSGPWAYITQSNQRHFYEKYAWLVERSRELDGFYNGWRASRLPNCSPRCPFCAPEAPTIRWIQNHNKIEPIEDHHEAALFEKCVKERPVPIVLRGRIDEQGTGRLEIGLNLPTLAHRALGKILNDHKITGQVDFHWRLDTKYNWPTEYKLNSFSIRDNKDIEPIAISFPGLDENGNPHTLRIEQQRSLGWMKGQEAEDGLPFQRQEIEEALAPQMNWRAEVRVRTPQTVLGGVLADEVGYGKTATTLALVHLQFENEKKSQQGRAKGKQRQETKSHETTCPGYIQTDANLFIVPKTIFMQWGKEITKFLGDSYTVIQLSGYKHLEGKTIREFRKAHIVLACSSLFTDRRYWENSARFAGLPEANTKERRAYTAWLKDVRSRSQEHVEIMKRSVSDLIAHLKELETAANNSCEYRYAQLSRRLTGAAYVEDVKNSTSKEQKQRQFTPRSYKSFEIPAEGTFEDVECPSLEIFKWRRVIGDEHQHYEQYVKIYFSQGLQAGSRWILSATPKMDDFADIRNMMRMVNVDIGIDDDAPGVLNGDTITEMRKLMTFVERFWTFNETHSPAWHQGRQAHAQVAMNQFVRKNLAEISEIPMKTHIRAVSLSTEELVRYVEHQQRLESHEMRIVFAGYAHIESDLTQILNSDIAGSTSGPELLVKLASFFTARESSPSTTANHKEAQSLVSRRKQEVDQLMAIIEKDARHAAWLHEQCHRSFKAANEVYNGSYYSKWKDNVLAAALGDHTACGMIAITIKKAEKEIRLFQKRDHYRHRPTAAVLEKEKSAAVKKNKDRKARHKTVTAEAAQLLKAILTSKVTAKDIKLPVKKPRKKKNVDGAANVDDAANVDGNEVDNLTKTRDTYIDKNDRILYATTIRKVMIELRRYSHELVSRLRALRFDACAQDLQLWKTGDDQVEPPRCGMEHCHDRHNDPNDIVLNSTCGHLACRKCIASQEDTETCPYKNCDASTEAFRLNTADDLTGECHNTVFGSKIDAIVNLLLYEIPEDEQALLFVQYEEMMGKIEEAFDKIGISNWALRALATDSTSRKMTDDFQDNTNPKTKKKVLILNSSNETSAGLNLTGPNHVIFVSPFVSETQHQYDSSKTQCIGRSRRYGQKKTVHVYRFVGLRTIDVDLVQQREERRLTLRVNEDGVKEWKLLKEDEMTPKELEKAAGYSSGYVEPEHDN